jgi:hypothetical protein
MEPPGKGAAERGVQERSGQERGGLERGPRGDRDR